MDQRQTLKIGEDIIDLLLPLMQNNEVARILYDDSGIERAEGMLTAIEAQASRPYIILSAGQKIFIDTIIAFNGIFKADYTEC
ncbi:MAG TPA: hypothetical protein VG847_08415 [Chitinophagaceae bacterium]|nr:hypothetical protein [Chitinophagaceae bacterium]